jgi:hypothetical protein
MGKFSFKAPKGLSKETNRASVPLTTPVEIIATR